MQRKGGVEENMKKARERWRREVKDERGEGERSDGGA